MAEEMESAGGFVKTSAKISTRPVVIEQQQNRPFMQAPISLDDKRSQNENEIIESVDLCDDDDNDTETMAINADMNSEVNEIVDLSKALSLTTQDDVIDLRSQEKAMECSQSILNNYSEQLNDGQGIEEYDRIWKSTANNSDSKMVRKTKTDIEEIPTREKKEIKSRLKPKENTPKVPKKRSTTKKTLCKCDSQTNKDKNNKKKTTPRGKPVPINTKSQANAASTPEMLTQNTDYNTTYETSTIQNQPPTQKTTNIVPKNTHQYPTETNAVTNTPTYQNQTSGMQNTTPTNMHLFPPTSLTNIPTKPRVNVTLSALNTPCKLIEDLSWVENIKYIREIQIEEYSPLNGLSESFWNNCEFPADWDDGQFSFL